MRSRSHAVSIRIAGSWDGLHETRRLGGRSRAFSLTSACSSRARGRSIGTRAADVAPAALVG